MHYPFSMRLTPLILAGLLFLGAGCASSAPSAAPVDVASIEAQLSVQLPQDVSVLTHTDLPGYANVVYTTATPPQAVIDDLNAQILALGYTVGLAPGRWTAGSDDQVVLANYQQLQQGGGLRMMSLSISLEGDRTKVSILQQ